MSPVLLILSMSTFAAPSANSLQTAVAPRDWQIKAEMEAKTKAGQDARIHDVEFETDLKFYRDLADAWQLAAGFRWTRADSAQNHLARWEQLSLGFRHLGEWFARPVRTRVLYHHLPDADEARRRLRKGSLELEITVKLPTSARTRTKFEYQLTEHILTGRMRGTELRQSKFELSPAYLLGRWGIGAQNKIAHKFAQGEPGGSHYEVAPFLNYVRKPFEATFKTAFRPFIAGTGRAWAEDWASRPVYSLELEMQF